MDEQGPGVGDDDLSIDPALRQILVERTGSPVPPDEGEEAADERIPVIARLTSADAVIPHLGIVARFGPIVTARVRLADLFDVRRHPSVVSLKASSAVSPTLAVSVPEIRATRADLGDAASPAVTGAGVTVAILDWGLDFAHPNLRGPDGRTRVRALWQQAGGPRTDSPAPFGYGRVFTRAQLDRAIAHSEPYAQGYNPIAYDSGGDGTHATHVADIAVGNGAARGSAPGVAPGAELLFVNLSSDDTRPEDDLGDSVHLLEAARWAVDTAGGPLVLHMSLGRTGGAHDASPLFVQALDQLLLSTPGVAVVMSCGNYYESRMHGTVRLATGTPQTIEWHLSAHASPSELELWYPGGDRIRAVLLSASGATIADLPPGANVVANDPTGAPLASGFHRLDDPGNGANHIDVFAAPAATPTVWRLRLEPTAIVDGTVDLYVERADPHEQSRLVAPVVSPAGTINTISGGRLPLCVAAYDPRDPGRAIGRFSSAGPTRDGRPKPEISAPGVGIVAARSAHRASNGAWIHDSVVAKSGTSMAAPHVTGVVALVFEAVAPRRLPMALTRWILLESARREPPHSPADALRYGAGRVDAHRAVTLARALVHTLSDAAAPTR